MDFRYQNEGLPDLIHVVWIIVEALEFSIPECESEDKEGYAYISEINGIINSIYVNLSYRYQLQKWIRKLLELSWGTCLWKNLRLLKDPSWRTLYGYWNQL